MSQQEKYPLVTSINGQKVVIWSLQQDKRNSLAIEKGFQLSSKCLLLEKDTSDLRSAIRVSQKLHVNDSLQLKECNFRYDNSKIATTTATNAAISWEGKYNKEKGKKVIWMIATPVALLLGILIAK
jgi:hypothetical protein